MNKSNLNKSEIEHPKLSLERSEKSEIKRSILLQRLVLQPVCRIDGV
jgi:hypothetical protein